MALTSLKAKSMNAAKQAKYTPQQMTAGLNNARWARFYAAVDAEASERGETLSQAERARRADNLMRAQVYAMIDAREKKRAAKKANALDNQHYQNERTTAASGCVKCGHKGAIDVMCATHLAEQKKAFSH